MTFDGAVAVEDAVEHEEGDETAKHFTISSQEWDDSHESVVHKKFL